jgi:5-formyltetrahydrofolate cyclo-ligase
VNAPADKALCRRQILDEIKRLSDDARVDKSAAAASALVGTDAFEAARSIMFFWPLSDEADPRDAISAALDAKKAVFLPHIEADQLRPVRLRDMKTPMERDGHGVQTPISRDYGHPADLDLVVAPGVGFDLAGGRLGRGGGYYDRFLPTLLPTTIVLGFGFEVQVIDQVARESHDVLLDGLITDQRVHVIDKRRDK